MRITPQLSKWLFLGLSLALGSPMASCQADTDPAAENNGVLNDVPSIAETLGTMVPTAPPLPTADPEQLALGQQIYALHCAACHGLNLEGAADWKTQNEDGSFRPPPHNVEGHTWHHSDRVLIEAIVEGGARLPDNIGGTSNMPAFGEYLRMRKSQPFWLILRAVGQTISVWHSGNNQQLTHLDNALFCYKEEDNALW